MKYLPTAVLSGLLLSSQIFAQVDETQIIPFQAGTPARAADMNQNIQTLITAINNNTAQIKSLREQLSIVPASINLAQPTLDQELAGSVFRMAIVESAVGGSRDRNGLTEIGNLRHKVFGEDASITLNADHTLSLTTNSRERESNLDINSGYDAADPSNPFPLIIDVNVLTDLDTVESPTFSGTWSVSGQVLTLNYDGESETYSVSVDGNTLLAQGSDVDNDDPNITMVSVGMDVATRIHKPQPNIEIDVETFGGLLDFNAVNNGPSELVNDTNTKTFKIKNTGSANLIIGSSSLIQEAGADFTFTKQHGPITIAPNSESTLLKLDNPLTQGSNRKDASVYIMTNDPDTPTFIVNIHSTNNP